MGEYIFKNLHLSKGETPTGQRGSFIFYLTIVIYLTQSSIKISASTIILNSGGNKAIKK
jgi:hypothetical protein